jgi:hypothetical protein
MFIATRFSEVVRFEQSAQLKRTVQSTPKSFYMGLHCSMVGAIFQ